jgi:uncharacterized protein (DUF427 family)
MDRGRIRIEDGHKRVRVYLGGESIADSVNVKLVWEVPYFPVYYFPESDVRMQLLTSAGEGDRSPSRGTAEMFDVKSGGRVAERAAYGYPDSPIEELHGHVAFVWGAMDGWFEEDEEVFVHARDPYTRVDILASSRHVRVEIDGVEVANSTHPTLLFETGLPVRYYLPKVDVRMDLLTPTDTHTACPYKGTADYWSVTIGDVVHEDVVWGYHAPFHESAKIAGLVCFYNEKVDIYIDGELQERPKTKFS